MKEGVLSVVWLLAAIAHVAEKLAFLLHRDSEYVWLVILNCG